MISACETGRMSEQALELFKVMVEFLPAMHVQRLRPGAIAYRGLISACEKGKQMIERSLQLFDEMQQQGIQPGVIAYSATISACG